MKNPIDRIKGFLDRRDAAVLDFSDPWETPIVPYWGEGEDSLSLEIIKIQDGNPILTWGTDFGPNRRVVDIDARDIPQDILTEVADFLNYRRHHLDRHAIIIKNSEK